MKLNNVDWQVCALEYAQRIKELGIKQESLWWWVFPDYGMKKPVVLRFDDRNKVYPITEYPISAFTVAELGETLADWQLVTRKINKTEWSCYCVTKFAHTPKEQFANTEANARAKMLIYLLENKLMEHQKPQCHQ